jgi:hypothetical protein
LNILSAGLLLFWGVYFGMAGTGNFLDVMKYEWHKGKMFRFSSNNFELLRKVASRYNVAENRLTFLFVVILCWELLSSVLYLAAFFYFLAGNTVFAQYSFFSGASFFAGLTLGNEAFIYYENEEEHVVMLLAQLISYVAFYVV